MLDYSMNDISLREEGAARVEHPPIREVAQLNFEMTTISMFS